MKDCGVLYFLFADDRKRLEKGVIKTHGNLLSRSVESLNRHMSDISTILFTNISSVDWLSYGLTTVVHKYHPSDLWVYKYECLMETPFSKTIHMDCDTYVCKSFYEVFHMLDKVDFAAPLSPFYFGKWPLDIPISFPELACGFMAYKSSDKVNKMLEYAKGLISTRKRGADEPYLRKALYEFTNVKHSVLPWEYTCIFSLPGFLMSEVKVFHGKARNIESIKKCFAGRHPKLFTGEDIVHVDYVGHRRFRVGLVEKYKRGKK